VDPVDGQPVVTAALREPPGLDRVNTQGAATPELAHAFHIVRNSSPTRNLGFDPALPPH